jgi:hypothetical protein
VAKCEIDECREEIPTDRPDHVFCDTHWLFVPQRLRERIARAYTPGQCYGRVKMTQLWFDLVGEAASAIERENRARNDRAKTDEKKKAKRKKA